ncbi:MAG: L-rhamnose mutarotase [Clostridia bacterium]|nr:L-rhamnose mutarotase [Clostridia bacterium]
MKRYGMVIGIDKERLNEYKTYHSEIWPEVAEALKKANIRNYSIYYKDGLLFSYYEYIGTDFENDMRIMDENETVKKWQEIMNTVQQPLKTRKEGEWWSEMDEIFHLE